MTPLWIAMVPVVIGAFVFGLAMIVGFVGSLPRAYESAARRRTRRGTRDMGPILATLSVTLILLATGVWVGVGLGLSGIFGLVQVLGFDRALDIVGKVTWEQNTSFVLVAIPMFIFMGEILFQSGIMTTVYLRAATLVSGVPGGLLQANIAACTVFAACSGSSVASAATIGSVGFPEIAKRGYSKPIALGSIAAGGTLGILIPPSIIFIVYGSLAEVSIGKLFLAGVLPGLGLAALYSLIYCGALSRGSVARAARAGRRFGRSASGRRLGYGRLACSSSSCWAASTAASPARPRSRRSARLSRS